MENVKVDLFLDHQRIDPEGPDSWCKVDVP